MSDTSSNASKRAKAAADKATQELEARLEALRAEMEEIKASLGKTAEKKFDALADVFSGDAVEDVMDELREMVSQIKEKAGAAEKKVVQTARDNPVQTLLVAFGVGFLASLLMRR
ncbi:MAG: hypothetical protein C0421_04680 [Hyphomonas sp.]|uniref:DUF883 family protein n=1 Tax=Hyphomonas sp. TaxID=87 RepID=UPI0025BBE3AE|nr:hypothetical protein [Hyphomonas sp.]MBA4338121.1 hypothetical protein [Hyphomonas sp.]